MLLSWFRSLVVVVVCKYLFIWLYWFLAAARRLSCPAARGILFSQPGIELVSSALAGRLSTPGSVDKSLPPLLTRFFQRFGVDASTNPKFRQLVNTGHVVSSHECWQCVPGGFLLGQRPL